MITKTLLTVWKQYISLAQKFYEIENNITPTDIKYLEKIKANPDIIEAAEFSAGIEEFYLAPTEEMRQYTPDFFKDSLAIGDDGAGNFIVWMDIKDSNSKILWVCHDPAVIVVLADSPIAFFEGLIEGFDSPTFREKEESALGNFFENIKLDTFESLIGKNGFYNGDSNELGLVETINHENHFFDFTHAQVGVGIRLDLNGRYTSIEPTDKVGVITVGKQSDTRIKSQQKQDLLLYTLMALCFLGFLYYFHQINNVTLIKSFLGSLGATFVIFLGFTSLYFWFDEWKNH